MIDEATFTAVRTVSRLRAYAVEIRRGAASVVHVYAAASRAEAERMARRELELFEALANTV
jgi:hypothetical protein